MRIEIVSDTVCPWCFIGKRRLERALAGRPDVEVEISWRAFQLNPDMPPGGLDRETYLRTKFGGEERAKHIYDPIRAAGDGEGLDFAFEKIARTPNTVDSHRLIHWSGEAGRQDALVELLFRRYFLEGADIGDGEVLAAIAGEAGMDAEAVRARLEGDDDVELIRAQHEHAYRIGVTGVPFFIVEGKYAISGAQDPGVFHQVFDLMAREGSDAEADVGADAEADAAGA